jgi:hypothetical protein
MTPTPNRKGRLLLCGLLLAAVVTACGVIVYFAQFRGAPPIPPDVEPDESEPAVAAPVRVARRRVLNDPRSAQAEGDLAEGGNGPGPHEGSADVLPGDYDDLDEVRPLF